MAWICDKNGNHRCEIKQLSYNGTFMEVSSITVTVESPAPIAFAIGDYIDWDYDGLRYTLDTAAGVEKQARRNSVGNAFLYENLVFLSPLQAAQNADFFDVILGNTNDFLTNTEFSFYGTAWDYAKRLEANLCRLYGSGTWKVRIWTNGTCYDATPATGIDTGAWENKLVDVAGIKCLGGFQQIYDLWGCAYVFSVVNGVNYVDFYDETWQEGGMDKIFAYGKGNGLYKIRHTPDADHVLVTRLRPYGSGDNIPANYYLNSEEYHVDGNESSELAISHLMLPASQWTKDGVKHPSNAYLEQNTDLYGVREGVVLWDGSDPELGEIKPSIYRLSIQDLLDLMAAGDSYRPDEAKWPDTTQRIDKIITGAAPVDNGVKNEAGYDFTETEASGSLAAHSFGTGGSYAYIDIEFDDLVMGTTPSVSHLAEFRIVPTSQNKIAVSFDVQASIAGTINSVTAYLTPYVAGVKVEDATYPCLVSEETISRTVDGITYTKRYNISLLDSTGNPIVFSTLRTGAVTFRFRAHIDFATDNSGFPYLRDEYAVDFDLIRGNKAIDGFFSVTIPQIGFDLSAAVANGAKLCMRSGANQPREFQIVPSSVRYLPDTDTWFVRCKRSVDQSISTYFPNSNAVIAAGDEYYFTGITMPPLYVEIAAQKLLSAATAWLALHSKPRMLSAVDVDNKVMAVEEIVLKEGMSLPISDTDLDIQPGTQESRIIDNIRIEEGSDAIRTFSVTLRDKKEKSSLDAAIRGATSNLATNSSVNEAVSAAVNTGHGSLAGRDMPNQHPISAITGLEEALLSSGFFELGSLSGLVQLRSNYDYLGPRKGLIFEANSSEDVNAHLEVVTKNVGGSNIPVLHSRLPFYSDSFVSAGGISPGGGAAPGNTSMQLITGGGRFTNGTDTLDVYSMTRVDQLIATAGQVKKVAGVSPDSNGDIPVVSLSTALGLGAAASYAVATSVSQGDTTHLVTGAAVHTAINSAVSSVLRFEGVSSTVITDGGTQTPTIDGVQVTPYKGMVVLYGAKEFVWGGSAWEELGDEASWALKTTTISAGTGLTGGGTLASNRTISLSQATQDSLALANTALQSHQTIYALTIKNSAGTNVLSYTPNSAAGSLTLTKAMVGLGNVDNTAAADYFTVLENSSNQISLTIGGTNKKLTVAYATKASQDSAGNQISTHYLPKATFDDMFEKVALSGGGYAIKAKYGLYTDQFLSAGGLSSGGGTGGIDLDAMWQSLTTTTDSHATDKIATGHIPDMASTYGYLKSAVTSIDNVSGAITLGTGLSIDSSTKILSVADNYVLNTGDTMTGALTIGYSGNYPLTLNNTSSNAAYSGIIFQIGGTTASTLLAGTNGQLIRGGAYTIYDSGNSNDTTVSWSASKILLGQTMPSEVTWANGCVGVFDGPSTGYDTYELPFAYASGFSIGASASIQIAYKRATSGMQYLCGRVIDSSGDGAWKTIYNEENLTKSVLTGLLDASGGYYLPLTGGMLSIGSNEGFIVKKNTDNVSLIQFRGTISGVETVMGSLGFYGVNNPVFSNTNNTRYTLYHSGNFSVTLNGSSSTSASFYAPTSAGTSGYWLSSNGSGAPSWTSPNSMTSGATKLLKRIGGSFTSVVSGGASINNQIAPATGLFPYSNYTNAVLNIDRYDDGSTNYITQLGFSATGMYLRIFSGAAPDATTPWSTFWHSGNSNKSDVAWQASEMTARLFRFTRYDTTGNLGYIGRGSGSDNNLIINNTLADIVFYTNSSERMRIDSSGNVGIGTNSPGYKLDVAGDCRIYSSTDGVNLYIRHVSSSTTYDHRIQGYGGSLLIGSESNQRAITITSDGKVGLRTSTISYDVCVTGNTQHYAGWVRVESGYSFSSMYGGYAYDMVELNSSGQNEICYGSSAGGVKWTKIYGNGISFYNSSRTLIGYFQDAGNFVCSGAVTAGSASDIRLKQNIKEMSSEYAMDIVMNAKPVTFEWNPLATSLYDQLKGKDLGLVAQYEEKRIPMAISPIYEKYKRIDYSKYVSPLLKVAQNHETRLQVAERKIEALERENRELRNSLNMN